MTPPQDVITFQRRKVKRMPADGQEDFPLFGSMAATPKKQRASFEHTPLPPGASKLAGSPYAVLLSMHNTLPPLASQGGRHSLRERFAPTMLRPCFVPGAQRACPR